MNALDRSTATQTNPVISPLGSADTLVQAAVVIRHVAYGVLPGREPLSLQQTQLLLEAAARALEFEAAQGGQRHA
ncbi:hypothetical protein ABZN20_18655 [Methylococcus sp. ANG]|uniref:hypothetical protein n=1 Tax=Methylococcus sp. ANG TaxID=3231903 RepID=UPI003457AE0B